MHPESHPPKESAHDAATLVARPSSLTRMAAALASLTLFAATLELSLGAMQRFSFPYLPLFRPDATLGVTLQPSTSARVRTRDGHITTVRVNAQGFRGSNFITGGAVAGAARRRVLVVGDSQAMGLHVEDHEALGVVLEPALAGSSVTTLAVPTYGPLEYAMLVERFVHASAIDDVIVLFAPANDFFEARVENRRRTTASLGFAARVTRPVEGLRGEDDGTFSSRLPDALGRSHVVYAARRILKTASADAALVDAPHLLARIGAQLLQTETRASPKRVNEAQAFTSRLGPALARIADACRAAGCRVHASVLPLDVEIEPKAWSKYARGRDTEERASAEPSVQAIVRALRAAAHDDMRKVGITAVDLTQALAEDAPGVFLPDDDHLSARGHAAVARALADALGTVVVDRDHNAARAKEPT